jgi:ubiquinone/menaquinone biosynthesis C-methylase UbiE
MLGRIFIALCSLPGLKKVLWRAWYDYLARSHRAPDWTFMNYGYAMPEGNTLTVAEKDEPDRHWIQLYHHVAGAVPLEGRTVLEVGSGRGGGCSFIKRYLRPARMIGVDLSKHAVNFSRDIHRIDGLEFRIGDAENLPLSDNSVDAVVNVESSHCYPSFNKFLGEVQRVLRPGGHFLYADFRERTNVEAWRKSLQDSGLDLLRETEITAHVVSALEQDDERKLRLINRIVPQPLRASFLDFAAVRGSVLFEGFQSGEFSYRSFVLRKQDSGCLHAPYYTASNNTFCGSSPLSRAK